MKEQNGLCRLIQQVTFVVPCSGEYDCDVGKMAVREETVRVGDDCYGYKISSIIVDEGQDLVFSTKVPIKNKNWGEAEFEERPVRCVHALSYDLLWC